MEFNGSGEAGFGQFDRDAKVNFGQDLIDPIVARAVLEVAGYRFEPQHRGLVEGAPKQAELELIESVKRAPAMLDGAASAFDRVFDALQCNQGVDSAQSAQGYRRALRLGSLAAAERESAAWRRPGCTRRRGQIRTGRSGYAHK